MTDLIRFPAPRAKMAFTGERFVPGQPGPIEHEHHHRYLFALQFCHGKRVLDIASGEGFGTALIAQVASEATGVDLSDEAVRHAVAAYSYPNLRFFQSPATNIPLERESVDVVISFETIEHFNEHEIFLNEVKRVLTPDGLMIISSPNKTVYSPTGQTRNEFHVRELSTKEFQSMLEGSFRHVVMLGQIPASGSLILPRSRNNLAQIQIATLRDDESYQLTSDIISPLYDIAVVTNGGLVPSICCGILHQPFYIRDLNATIARLERHVRIGADAYDQIASERQALRDSTRTLKLETERSRLKNTALLNRIARQRRELAQTEAKACIERGDLMASLEAARAELAANRASTSWRITMPLRMIARLMRGQFAEALFVLRRRLNPAASLPSTSPPSDPSSSTPAIIAKVDVPVRSCLIVCTPHTRFVGALISRVLMAEGFSVEIQSSTKEADLFENIFVICPQFFPNLPDRFFAVQLEQSVSSHWFTEQYFDILERAEAVIDYSLLNVEYLINSGLEYNKIFYVPIGIFPKYAPPGPLFVDEASKYDVLFYGDINCERRQTFLNALHARFKLRVESDLFGAEIVEAILRAKVVVNIHYYEGALLETCRIYEVLSMGIPIVSESSTDIDEHGELIGPVEFTPTGDVDAMIAAIARIIDNDEERKAAQNRVASFSGSNKSRFERYFRRFLLAKNLISFARFMEVHPDYVPQLAGPAKFCLTLPETPARGAMFASSGLQDFRMFDGLRAAPGWRGCAMSYKFLFSELLRRGIQEPVTVCEDDAFLARADIYPLVLEYLERNKGQWDMFSGFMADIDQRVKILDIQTYKGLDFIYVTGPTSTVFNIYNTGMIRALSGWDPDDPDVETNTIDRLMQRTSLRVLTTWPFIAGHREEASSTLWGIKNSAYNEMFDRSARAFNEMIAAFRARRAVNGEICAKRR